jgi:hypothetical protein
MSWHLPPTIGMLPSIPYHAINRSSPMPRSPRLELPAGICLCSCSLVLFQAHGRACALPAAQCGLEPWLGLPTTSPPGHCGPRHPDAHTLFHLSRPQTSLHHSLLLSTFFVVSPSTSFHSLHSLAHSLYSLHARHHQSPMTLFGADVRRCRKAGTTLLASCSLATL